jgi:nicotinate phosphoribosyltransferase
MAAQLQNNGFLVSILDTDLYKVKHRFSAKREPGSDVNIQLTMQQAVLHHFPAAQATYRFTHRDKDRFFSFECFERFREAVAGEIPPVMRVVFSEAPIYAEFSKLSLTHDELLWLRQTCPYLTAGYLDYLAGYRYKPEQVRIVFHPVTMDGGYGNLEIEATGPWVETIFWEVPLMACLSEIYFRTTSTDWSYEGQAGRRFTFREEGLTVGASNCCS